MEASPTQINVIFGQLAAKADAIIKITGDIELIKEGGEDLLKTLTDARLDELSHVQDLTIALTEALTTEEEEGEGGGGAE